MDEHWEFLLGVKQYISEHPEVAAKISDYVAAGISESRREALERAADMEVALTVALAKKFKKPNELILSKIEKWQGRSSLNWESAIEELRKEKTK